MKRLLIIAACILGFNFAIIADELEDSIDHYAQQLSEAFNEGDYLRAYDCFDNILRVYRNQSEDISQDTVYAYLEGMYANFCYQIGDYETAIDLGKDITDIYKVYGTDNLQYSTSLNNLALFYSSAGYNIQAIQLGSEAMNINKKLLGTDNSHYATDLQNLSVYYYNTGDYREAIGLVKESMEIRKKLSGIDDPNYIKSFINLISCYSAIGDYKEALNLGIEALDVMKNAIGADHPDYSILLNNVSAVYANIGDYKEAIRLESEALDIRRRVWGEHHPYYAKSLGNLATYYSEMGDYTKAIKLGTKALEIRKQILGENHPEVALSLSTLAQAYFSSGDYRSAIELDTQALEIRKQIYGTEHPEYALSLNGLASCFFILGDFSKAIELESQTLNIFRTILGEEHVYCATALSELAYLYYEKGNYDEALQLIDEYVPIVQKNVFRSFSGLTAKERLLYWDSFSNVLNSWYPEILAKSNIANTAPILYNNIALFAKGLLLSTELEMVKLIQESGDDEALQMYSELQTKRQMLNLQYSKPIAERYLNCDSLERVSNDLERQLVSRVKAFGDYTRNLTITWQEVQSKLNDNDIAIEFLSYPENDGEIHYSALTLCNNDTAPILTPLFVESKLIEASREDNTYQTGAADSLVWGPLSSRLEGKSKVYFSASGMLYNIGIEYLSSMDGKDCYRLSSTRELVIHEPCGPMRSSSLYGGIDYDAFYASIESSIPSSVKDYAMNETSQYRGFFDYRSINNGVSALPGTRIELDEVSALMKPLGVPYDAFTGTQASEESFKALSGQHRSLLHISTHGFYYNDEKANNLKSHIRWMLMGDDRPAYVEDRSLLRCGLCFAGANQTLLGKSTPPDGQEDGILNALEIAQTDLRGLDLVVLSACQTALGDVAQGEGVFGLQRGFKKAGANSILMGLWNVDDLTTPLLMVEFYRNYLAGKSKLESLRKAQQYVRDYQDENGNKLFDDPYYWAGFILLDALD